jgi:hypothetical protein
MESEKVFRRRLAAAENMAVRQRNYRRARDRALAKLAQKYKEEYLELLAEEKAKDEQEGKRWHNLAGSVPGNWVVPTDRADNTNRRDTLNIQAHESDN